MSKFEQFVTFRRKNENNYDLDPKIVQNGSKNVQN